MRIARQLADEEEAINLMPLIDMVFLLLIFFLVATTIASEERELDMQLPTTAMVQPLSAPPQQVIINVMQDGTKRIAGKNYPDPDLRNMLQRMAENEPNREVLIRADQESMHKYFAGVASMCREVGINEVKIGYIFSGDNP